MDLDARINWRWGKIFTAMRPEYFRGGIVDLVGGDPVGHHTPQWHSIITTQRATYLKPEVSQTLFSPPDNSLGL